jgi:hypothetical protein
MCLIYNLWIKNLIVKFYTYKGIYFFWNFFSYLHMNNIYFYLSNKGFIENSLLEDESQIYY